MAGAVVLLIYTYMFLKLGWIREADLGVLKEISRQMGRPRVLERVIRFLGRYA